MGNFYMYPGLFVRVTESVGPLVVGESYQVMYVRWGSVAFVGINGRFCWKKLGRYLEPIIPREQDNK